MPTESTLEPSGPSSLQTQLKSALQHYADGQFAQALEALNGLAQVWPTNSEVQLNLGNVHFKLEALPQAEQHWKKALELDPMEATAYLNLGNLYFKQDRLEEALLQWDICKRLQRQNPTLWLNMGVAYERLEEPEKAMEHYSVFLGLQSGSVEAARLKQRFDATRKQFENQISTSEQALAKGDRSAARQLMGKALATYPGTARIYKTYASLLYQDGEFAPALRYYMKAYLANPTDIPVLINLGVIFERLDQPVDAVWAYCKASRLPSEDQEKVARRFSALLGQAKPLFANYLQSAQSLCRQGKLQQAQEKLERLNELGPHLGALMTEVTEWREKVEDQMDPSAKAARTYLVMGQDAKNAGRFDQAMTFFQKYLRLKPTGSQAEAVLQQLSEMRSQMGAVIQAMLAQDRK